MEDLNIASLAKYFSDEAAAWKLVEDLRWPGPETRSARIAATPRSRTS